MTNLYMGGEDLQMIIQTRMVWWQKYKPQNTSVGRYKRNR